MPIFIILYISDLLLYAVIPVTSCSISIQVNPRCYKCEVTSYYLEDLIAIAEKLICSGMSSVVKE